MKRPAHRTRAEVALDAKITRLRQLLLTSEDLTEPSTYFHEELVPNDAFMAACSRQDQPRLVEIISAVLRAQAPAAQPGKPMVLRLARHRLCHGCAVWGGGLAMFVYFEEEDVGFCTYQRDLLDPQVCFTRFSVTQCNGWSAPRERGSA